MRGIKPEFWTDEKVMALSPMARLLFIGMWHLACDNGHVSERPIELKARIFPMDPLTLDEMKALVQEVVGQALIEDCGEYLTVPNFGRHQRIDKRWKTTCDHCGSTRGHDEDASDHDEATRGHDETTRGPASSRDEGEGEGEVKVKGGAGGGGSRRKRPTAAPESLEITEEMKTWAAEKAPNVNLAEATEEFLTWARSVDKRYVDWTAAWRNAIKRRQEWAVRDGRHLRSVDQNSDLPDWMLA